MVGTLALCPPYGDSLKGLSRLIQAGAAIEHHLLALRRQHVEIAVLSDVAVPDQPVDLVLLVVAGEGDGLADVAEHGDLGIAQHGRPPKWLERNATVEVPAASGRCR